MATQAAPHIRTETNGPVVAGFAIGFIVVNVAFTSLRFFTRTTILKAVGKDDWAILAATVLSIVYSIAMLFEVNYGMGRHVENVTAPETLEQLKFLVLGILSYNTGMNVTKLGFLFQYRRIFHSKTLQTVCFWFIIYVCAWSAVQSTLLLLSCFPFPIIVPSMADKCLTTLPIWYFSSAMSTITDVLIFCIPLHSVWQLQLPVKQRLMVLGIFGLGFFVCIISVYRISTLYRSVISTDPTWDNIDAAIWSAVELGVSILASNLPTLRPLLSRLRPGHGFSSGPRGRASSYILSDRHGTHKSSPNKSLAGERGARPGSVGTDELALRDMDVEGGAAAGPYATYATASSDPRGTYAPGEQENSGCIVKTTDITVNSGRR
ncbi:hypothetical protein RB595_000317 [Gaeumannomyces hyphopodioides]